MSPERQTPVPIEEEMRKSYLDYAMSVIVGRALPDVRDGLKPVHRRVLFAMNEHRGGAGTGPTRSRRASSATCMGKYHPHGDSADLRHARAHGAGLLAALPAGGRAGELRLHRRRSGGGHAVHRGAAGAHRRRDAGATSTRTPSTSSPTTTRPQQEPVVLPTRIPEPPRQRLLGHRRRHGDQHPAPQPDARSCDGLVMLIENPDDHGRRPDEGHPGPGFPDGRLSSTGAAGIREAYTHRAGHHHAAGQGARREAARRPRGHHRHRAALPGEQGHADREDRRAHPRQEDRGHLRAPRRVEPRGHPHRAGAGARGDAADRHQPALQAHRRCRPPSASSCWPWSAGGRRSSRSSRC